MERCKRAKDYYECSVFLFFISKWSGPCSLHLMCYPLKSVSAYFVSFVLPFPPSRSSEYQKQILFYFSAGKDQKVARSWKGGISGISPVQTGDTLIARHMRPVRGLFPKYEMVCICIRTSCQIWKNCVYPIKKCFKVQKSMAVDSKIRHWIFSKIFKDIKFPHLRKINKTDLDLLRQVVIKSCCSKNIRRFIKCWGGNHIALFQTFVSAKLFVQLCLHLPKRDHTGVIRHIQCAHIWLIIVNLLQP